MGRIFLVRHGQTVHNRDRILQGPRLDGPLSELGQRQADSVADALADVRFAALYSSPMARARQTAQALVHRHARGGEMHPGVQDAAQPTVQPAGQTLSIQVVPELYEMDYGHLAGRSYDEVQPTLEQVIDAWRMGFPDEPFPGGESAVVAQMRIRPFAKRALELVRGRDHDVAVIGHGRINRILIATWTGAGLGRLEDFPQANAALTEVEVTRDAVRLVRLNDTSHLSLATDAFA